jgi:hypothetical protein
MKISCTLSNRNMKVALLKNIVKFNGKVINYWSSPVSPPQGQQSCILVSYIVLVTFCPILKYNNLAISNDTSNFIGNKIKTKFVDFKVSVISKTGLVDFELYTKHTLQKVT